MDKNNEIFAKTLDKIFESDKPLEEINKYINEIPENRLTYIGTNVRTTKSQRLTSSPFTLPFPGIEKMGMIGETTKWKDMECLLGQTEEDMKAIT